MRKASFYNIQFHVSTTCTFTFIAHDDSLLADTIDTVPIKKISSCNRTASYELTASPCLLTTSPSTLKNLCQDLCQVFTETKATGVTIDRFQEKQSFNTMQDRITLLISQYIASGATDWKAYVEFNSLHYIRHLVDANDDFELIIICWASNQASRVHNHGNSHCFLTVLDGVVEEHRFKEGHDMAKTDPDKRPDHVATPPLPGILQTISPCPHLIPDGINVVDSGTTAYINDDIALHAVKCPATCITGAVSLHLYSPPITRVRLYDSETNKVIVRQPGFYSKRGVRT